LGERAQRRAGCPDHRAGGRPELAGQDPQQRGLAGAVGPDQAHPVTGVQHQIDPGEQGRGMEMMGQGYRFEHAKTSTNTTFDNDGCPVEIT
jgi:hypothetical protein